MKNGETSKKATQMSQVGQLVPALGCQGQGGRVGLIRFADRSAGRNKDRKS